jgi:hypothetical protein
VVTPLTLAGIYMGSHVETRMPFAAAIGAGFTRLAVVAALHTAVSTMYACRCWMRRPLRSAPDVLPVDEGRMVPSATLAVTMTGTATLPLRILPHRR